MNQNTHSNFWRVLVLVLAGGLILFACGDDDSSDNGTSSTADDAVEAEGSTEGPSDDADSDDASDDAAPSGGGDLLVPLDYLQGDWCDHEGTSWTIDGEMATLDDGSGGVGQMPINILFANVIGNELISQADDQFVFMSGEDEVTFTRGAC